MPDPLPPRPSSDPNKGFLLRAQSILVLFGGLYALVVVLLAIPFFQTHTLYLNAVKLPWFAKFDIPEKYGLAPGKTLNFNIQTSDNVTLGAWFILSDPFYHSLPSPLPISSTLRQTHIPLALKTHPTILFFHGNAATRAFQVRVQHYSAFSSRLGANVLAIDYRGFGDSTGVPSEKGLALDARAAWDWLVGQGVKTEDVLIVGHSLGTAVAGRLAADLGEEGIGCRGVVLMSPLSSIRTLLDTYNIFGVFPLMKPLAMIPGAPSIVTRSLIHKFDTLRVIPEIKAHVLLAHAEDDWDIPYSHSEVLFSEFLRPHLPSLPEIPINPATWSKEDWDGFTAQQSARNALRRAMITSESIHNFGTRDEFSADGRKVVLLKTFAGGHDRLGTLEGVQDIIGKTFHL